MQESNSRFLALVWDLPTRLFHWLLALLVLAQYISGLLGGDALPIHARIGYLICALLLFRMGWGVIGGHWSKFSSFAPFLTLRGTYLRPLNRPPADATETPSSYLNPEPLGHTLLGTLSIFTMLALLMLQVVSGCMSSDDILFEGPVVHLVSARVAEFMTQYHSVYGFYLLIALTLLHLAAVAYYELIKQRRIIAPMLSGVKESALEVPVHMQSKDTLQSRLKAATLFLACALLVYGVLSLIA